MIGNAIKSFVVEQEFSSMRLLARAVLMEVLRNGKSKPEVNEDALEHVEKVVSILERSLEKKKELAVGGIFSLGCHGGLPQTGKVKSLPPNLTDENVQAARELYEKLKKNERPADDDINKTLEFFRNCMDGV